VVSLADAEGGRTHAVLHQVLVTEVQGAPAPVEPATQGDPETASAGTPAPTQSLMVTLAVTAHQAEAVVFGVEHGTLWLSLEPAKADTSGTAVVDGSTIYGKSF
jgi:pilus assembly protein CpaB